MLPSNQSFIEAGHFRCLLHFNSRFFPPKKELVCKPTKLINSSSYQILASMVGINCLWISRGSIYHKIIFRSRNFRKTKQLAFEAWICGIKLKLGDSYGQGNMVGTCQLASGEFLAEIEIGRYPGNHGKIIKFSC